MVVPETASPGTVATVTRLVKSPAVGSADSITRMPMPSATVRALTRLTCSSTWPAKAPASTAEVSSRVSNSASAPEQVTSMRSKPPPESPAASRPSFEASGRNGPSTSMSSARACGMLTALETNPPVSAAATCSATITPARSCASWVDAPRCGVTTTLGSVRISPSV